MCLCETSDKNIFKRYSSMKGIAAKSIRQISFDEVVDDQSIEILKSLLESIKSSIDKIELKLKNPIDVIKEHFLKHRTKWPLLGKMVSYYFLIKILEEKLKIKNLKN